MKNEIRNLLANYYTSEHDDAALDIFANDDGVHIVHIDYDLNFAFEWIIDKDRVVQTNVTLLNESIDEK